MLKTLYKGVVYPKVEFLAFYKTEKTKNLYLLLLLYRIETMSICQNDPWAINSGVHSIILSS